MDILIVCVNYNSYKELNNYLISIDESVSIQEGVIHTDVVIADNSTDKEIIDLNSFSHISVKEVDLDNLGYLGGAQAIINNIENISRYKYVIVSNVDLVFKKDTMSKLLDYDLFDDVAWVAPDIYSEKFQKRLNPNVLTRYKSWKLRLLKMTYNRFAYLLYEKLYYAKKNKTSSSPNNSDIDIYAGHGSCIILTSNFFKCYKQINYPIFLYGEELFFAELILRKGMRVRYVPDIKLITTGSVSTSKMPSKKFFKYNVEAINYILKTFY